MAVVFFFLRVLSRYCNGFKATWGLDDLVMIPTVVGLCYAKDRRTCADQMQIASIPMTVLSFVCMYVS